MGEQKVLDLQKLVGGGYSEFWNCRKRYLVCKGSKGSKKSKTSALRFIYNLQKYHQANLLVIRQVFDTHRNSTFLELKWAIRQLGTEMYWKETKSPLELTYLPTKQKIIFAGLDDFNKLASLTVETGYLCWIWWEEAFEVPNEEIFDRIDLGMRGKLPEELWKQNVITFNPWSGKHWLKKKFFDNPDPDVLAMTTTFFCNEFLGDDDLNLYNKMKKNNPRRFLVAGLGEWGVSEGLIYDNVRVEAFNKDDLLRQRYYNGLRKYLPYAGLDFGFTNNPTAIVDMLVNEKESKIYICQEWYQAGMTNAMIAAAIHQLGMQRQRIYADSAEPKSIQEIKTNEKYPCPLITAVRKGPDSVRAGIQTLQDYEIIVHPKCINFITEINGYCWEVSKTGAPLNNPVKEFDHLMDSMRYGMSKLKKKSVHC